MAKHKLSLEEQNKLVTDNLALITFLIRKYIYIGEDEFDDLFQEGALYMTIAARRFDPERGIKFSTYASAQVVGGLKRYKRDKSSSRHGLKVTRGNLDIINKYTMHMNDEGFSEESFAEELGITIEKLNSCKLNFYFVDNTISNHSQKDEDSGTTFGDTLGDIDINYNEIEAEIDSTLFLEKAKEKLKDTYYDILEEIIYSYTIGGEKLKQHDIGLRYGMSQPQVSRVIREIRRVIKEILVKDGTYIYNY